MEAGRGGKSGHSLDGMTAALSICVKGKPEPKLKGKKPRFYCKRCGLVARKKKQLCKAKRI